jgi:hypothetical protein
LSLSLLCRCYKTLYKVRKATSIARTKHGGTAWLRASHWWTLTTNGHVLGARYLPVTFRAKEISYQQKPPLQKNPRQRRLLPKSAINERLVCVGPKNCSAEQRASSNGSAVEHSRRWNRSAKLYTRAGARCWVWTRRSGITCRSRHWLDGNKDQNLQEADVLKLWHNIDSRLLDAAILCRTSSVRLAP